ncbi:MAG: M23 family metallopeptidase [Oscillospiraceae bacterium]|nr:M23 family metallopeptidase [Oscillospiraceae bacterium]
MRNKKFSGSVSGKGYYIALVLCAVAIGVSGFLYYRNADKTDKDINADVPTASQPLDDQQVVATNPDGSLVTDPDEERPAPPKNTAYPVAGQTVAVYAMDSLTYNETTRDWRVHNGIDIAAEAGTNVCAAADGEVYTVYDDETMGMTVVIRHADGYTTKYASLAEEVSVKPGDTVTVGQTIGMVGNSALLESAIGDHVHFSVSCDGAFIDPAEFFTQE